MTDLSTLTAAQLADLQKDLGRELMRRDISLLDEAKARAVPTKGAPDFAIICAMGDRAPYNPPWKDAFRAATTATLRRVAKDLGLLKGSFKISFSPGGIAGAGDAYLEHERFHVSLSRGVFDHIFKSLGDIRGVGRDAEPQPILSYPGLLAQCRWFLLPDRGEKP